MYVYEIHKSKTRLRAHFHVSAVPRKQTKFVDIGKAFFSTFEHLVGRALACGVGGENYVRVHLSCCLTCKLGCDHPRIDSFSMLHD